VPLSLLPVYLADAQTRWQSVTVSDEPDDGGTGDAFVTPEHLAGKTVDDFAGYGDHTTPENALDELIQATE